MQLQSNCNKIQYKYRAPKMQLLRQNHHDNQITCYIGRIRLTLCVDFFACFFAVFDIFFATFVVFFATSVVLRGLNSRFYYTSNKNKTENKI